MHKSSKHGGLLSDQRRGRGLELSHILQDRCGTNVGGNDTHGGRQRGGCNRGTAAPPFLHRVGPPLLLRSPGPNHVSQMFSRSLHPHPNPRRVNLPNRRTHRRRNGRRTRSRQRHHNTLRHAQGEVGDRLRESKGVAVDRDRRQRKEDSANVISARARKRKPGRVAKPMEPPQYRINRSREKEPRERTALNNA